MRFVGGTGLRRSNTPFPNARASNLDEVVRIVVTVD